MPDTATQNHLALAAKRLGKSELAKRMSVSESLLAAWIQGHVSMPVRKLLVLADLIEKLGDEPSG